MYSTFTFTPCRVEIKSMKKLFQMEVMLENSGSHIVYNVACMGIQDCALL